jgi:hypothetical protein
MADEQVVVLIPEQLQAALANLCLQLRSLHPSLPWGNLKDFMPDPVKVTDYGEERALNCTLEITFGS